MKLTGLLKPWNKRLLPLLQVEQSLTKSAISCLEEHRKSNSPKALNRRAKSRRRTSSRNHPATLSQVGKPTQKRKKTLNPRPRMAKTRFIHRQIKTVRWKKKFFPMAFKSGLTS